MPTPKKALPHEKGDETEQAKEIYHLATESDFRSLAQANIYIPSSFEKEGFIHCTGDPETLLVVAGDYFATVAEPVLVLTIVVARLAAEVKFEPPAPIEGGGTAHLKNNLLFPHIYGPLNLDAVTGVGALQKKEGRYTWPEHFVTIAEFLRTKAPAQAAAVNDTSSTAEQTAASHPNLDRFSGLAGIYDAHRPQPPLVLLDVLTQLAQIQRPHLVVDLGSGTGLSTFVWAGRAEQGIGIEPNDDMRGAAERRTVRLPNVANVRFQAGVSTQTGLPDGCADIVTCSQALHWMAPEPTLAEVARILRPGGVFAAYDYLWPPTIQWQAEAALVTFMHKMAILEKEHGQARGLQRWPKHEHLNQIRASGHFRYVKELWLHHREMGNTERLIGIALSSSAAGRLLEQGLSEAEIGLADLRAVAQNILGDEPRPWYFSYQVRVGVK